MVCNMKIWALFNVNGSCYDQPEHNLHAWWSAKPCFEVLLAAIGGSFESEKSIIAAANIMQGAEDTMYQSYIWSLEQITEGLVSNDH